MTLPSAAQAEKTDTGLTRVINPGVPMVGEQNPKLIVPLAEAELQGLASPGAGRASGTGNFGFSLAEITCSYRSGGPVSERFFPM